MGVRAIRDDGGNTHSPAQGGARIISLVPSITELLFALGLGDQVVGRTTFCVHPAEALRLVPRVGGTKNLRFDRLRDLRPTHVIMNIDENRREDAEVIKEFVPNIVVTHPTTPTDNIQLYHLLGAVFDRQDQARRLETALLKELRLTRAISKEKSPRNVLYLIWKEPWMTVSEPTYISRMLALINWKTLGHDPETRYPEIALDSDVTHSADLILLSSEPFPFKAKHQTLVKALVPDADVQLVDGELISWYGARAIAGVRYLRDLVRLDTAI